QNKNIITGRLRARGASTTHTPSRVVGPAHGGDAYEEAQAAAGAHSTALPRTIVVFTPVSSASRRSRRRRLVPTEFLRERPQAEPATGTRRSLLRRRLPILAWDEKIGPCSVLLSPRT